MREKMREILNIMAMLGLVVMCAIAAYAELVDKPRCTIERAQPAHWRQA